jgi:hypothetical protein
MTTRTSRAIRAGLRRIIADPKTSRSMRMKAIQLLLAIEGLPDRTGRASPAEAKASANTKRLKDLAARVRQERQENLERDHLALVRSVDE